MGPHEEWLLPHLTDLALRGRTLDEVRGRVASGIAGDVLEIGFGSGRNISHYPDAVNRIMVVEPSTESRKLAEHRIATSPVPVEYVGVDGQNLPIEDGSVDHVLTTWTLCTIPRVDRALEEIRRVLRLGGALHFVEHGLAPDVRIAKWQNRLTPLQRRLAGGCHLNRRIDELVVAAGLEIEYLQNYYTKGPRAFGYMFEGRARRKGPEF